MTDQTLAQQLAAFAAKTTFDTLPEAVVRSTKERILDSIGIQLAATEEKLADGVIAMVDVWGGTGESGIVGRSGKYPAPSAALVNGTLAHSLDFDDTHLPSVLHPSASIVPATLAMAEATGASGKDAIVAAALGIEICVRIGMGGYLPDKGNVWFEKGWHATSICGALGAAALSAKLLGLDATGIANSFGIAASMASGVIEANRTGGTIKRLHCGWAAHAGITAALLVKNGYTGPPTVFEGRFGLFTAFLDGAFSEDNVVRGLGETWELPDIFYKPYPANHYTHAGIDAALAIRKQLGTVVPAEIAKIELGSATAPLRTIGEPRAEKIRPQSGYHAQFSGPFTVASALMGGGGLGVSFNDFTDAMAKDADRLALAAKVETFVDAECEKTFPVQFPAVVRVTMNDGRVFEERVMANRGGPKNPLSEDELRLKFSINANRLVSEDRANQIASTILSLESQDTVSGLLALCRQ